MTDIVAPQKIVKCQTRPNTTVLFRRLEGDLLFAATYAMDLLYGTVVVLTTTNTRTGHGVVSYMDVNAWNELADHPRTLGFVLEGPEIAVRKLDAACKGNPHTCNKQAETATG
jgi:hypothetical protein